MSIKHQDFTGVIETIYSAALDDSCWPQALSAIADHLSAVDATLEVYEPGSGVPLFFRSGTRLPVDGVDAFLAHYASICPRAPHMFQLGKGETACDYDILDERQIDHDEFYVDFLAPAGLRYFLGGILDLPIRGQAGIYIQRSPRQGHADHEALNSLKRLMPHLSRALDLYLRISEQANRTPDFLELLSRLPQAVVALDRRGDIVAANDTAVQVFRDQDGLACRKQQLETGDSKSTRHLAATIKSLLNPSADTGPPGPDLIPVRRPSGLPPYLLAVRRISTTRPLFEASGNAVLLVFIQGLGALSPPTHKLLMQGFSLTPREAELALALLRGDTVQEHARIRGVRVSTVRTQLKALLRKLDVHSQLELVRLLSALHAIR